MLLYWLVLNIDAAIVIMIFIYCLQIEMVKLVYNYHPIDFTYMSQSTADESPLEPGVYLIPANSTITSPPPFESIPSNHTLKWDNIKQNWFTEALPLPIIKEEDQKSDKPRYGDAMTQLREFRDRTLKELDWIAIKYYTKGLSFPVEWANYFQALRDLPANIVPTLDSDGKLDMTSINSHLPSMPRIN